MQGFALSSSPELEVLSAYSAPQDEIPAVAASPGWHVVGAFFLEGAATLKLELIGSVSDSALAMRARLFDLATNQPVSGILPTIVSETDVRVLSAAVELAGNRTFQIQVEVTGGSGFGVVRSAAPTV
jgi:hypothetical protein